ncbi:ribosome maturation factor RimM [Methylobacillus flagellatus]|uniref:ribosome maturation factor RimM n=1 Tax=Methylobacillus flagellatus TaxID=405 RepID=UPI002570262F|nr:ribosome maturation factor RimM [Methylobacillus flagellatus]
MVVMGRIVAPYGIFGWLKIQPDTETLDSLLDYPDWWLGKNGQWQKYAVETAKVHGNTLVVKLEGVDDRDAAFAMKSKQVAVPREQLPAPDENEYYWSDLIGLDVVNLQQVPLGQIIDVFETGANDVLVVKEVAVKQVAQPDDKQAEARERLIPFIAQVVLQVDIAAKTMQVDWDETF